MVNAILEGILNHIKCEFLSFHGFYFSLIMKYNLNKEYNNVHQQKKGISDFDTKVPRLAYNALLNYAFLSVVHYAEDN